MLSALFNLVGFMGKIRCFRTSSLFIDDLIIIHRYFLEGEIYIESVTGIKFKFLCLTSLHPYGGEFLIYFQEKSIHFLEANP